MEIQIWLKMHTNNLLKWLGVFFFLEYSAFFKSTQNVEKEFANTDFALTPDFIFIRFIKRLQQ